MPASDPVSAQRHFMPQRACPGPRAGARDDTGGRRHGAALPSFPVLRSTKWCAANAGSAAGATKAASDPVSARRHFMPQRACPGPRAGARDDTGGNVFARPEGPKQTSAVARSWIASLASDQSFVITGLAPVIQPLSLLHDVWITGLNPVMTPAGATRGRRRKKGAIRRWPQGCRLFTGGPAREEETRDQNWMRIPVTTENQSSGLASPGSASPSPKPSAARSSKVRSASYQSARM